MPQAAPTVLLVDAADRLRRLLEPAPELTGVQFRTIGVSSDAVRDAFRSHNPAAVVLDVVVGAGASWEALLAIRREDPSSTRPVIFTTDVVRNPRFLFGNDYYLSQSALPVGADGTGVATLIDRIRHAVGRSAS
jgi:CheY-like chemotaxis protein